MVHGLLDRHLPTDLARDLLTPAEQAPHLPGEHAAAAVVLKRQLAEMETQPGGDRSIEDLFDLLQLDEVVARADGAEPHARQLPHGPGELASHAVDAAVALDVEATAGIDPVELCRIDPEPVGREVRPLGRAPHEPV